MTLRAFALGNLRFSVNEEDLLSKYGLMNANCKKSQGESTFNYRERILTEDNAADCKKSKLIITSLNVSEPSIDWESRLLIISITILIAFRMFHSAMDLF